MTLLKPRLFFVTLLLFLHKVSTTYDNFDTFLLSTPQKFGIFIQAGNDQEKANKQIDNYATMQCPQISEVAVVVQGELILKDKDQNWKRPVYIQKTNNLSKNGKFAISTQSKAKVFFTLDAEASINCKELLRTFGIWKQHSAGDLGPIISFVPSGYDIQAIKSKLTYVPILENKFYQINSFTFSWVSRYFFQVYNSYNLQEIRSIKRQVQKVQNCEDIAFNFVINYLFPELEMKTVQGDLIRPLNQTLNSLDDKNIQISSQCLANFTQITGRNPLKILYSGTESDDKRWKVSTLPFFIYTRKSQLTAANKQIQINSTKQLEKLQYNLQKTKKEVFRLQQWKSTRAVQKQSSSILKHKQLILSLMGCSWVIIIVSLSVNILKLMQKKIIRVTVKKQDNKINVLHFIDQQRTLQNKKVYQN